MTLWKVTKEYDLVNLKTNIVSVEPYPGFYDPVWHSWDAAKDIGSVDLISAVDELGAWKIAREMFSERD